MLPVRLRAIAREGVGGIAVKLQRRIRTTLKHQRIRKDHATKNWSAGSSASVGLWAPEAVLPGNEDALASLRSRATQWTVRSRAVKEHRIKLFSDSAYSLDIQDDERRARLREAACELPPSLVHSYVPVDWHRDFMSGHRWNPAEFYLDVRVAPVPGADIKVPRELSRFQHIGALFEGPFEEAGHEYILQVLDWIIANPTRLGVNWACTMDVALRAVSWIWAVRAFEPILLRYPKASTMILHSLEAHAVHILDNLEYYQECTSNHYLSNVVGLIYLGGALPQLPAADHWLRFGLQELVSEMEREVYEDGGDYEASTHYHRLVGELFVSAASLAERIPAARRERLSNIDPVVHTVEPALKQVEASGLNLSSPGRVLPTRFYEQLARMGEFTASLTKPNRRVPQFGDNDSARAHFTLPDLEQDVRDHSYLVGAIGKLTGHLALQHAGGSAAAATEVLCGDLRERNGFAPTWNRDFSDKLFEKSGIAVSQRGPAWLAVTCGPNGQGGRGGHGHNDKLGFELSVNGIDFIVDGGCPRYTSDPACRNRFRSTWAHSTIAVLGMEQDVWPDGPAGLFRLPEQSHPQLELAGSGIIRGSHRGFGARHCRLFKLTETGLRIEDMLDLAAERWLSFNLDPAVAVRDVALRGDELFCRLVHERGEEIWTSISGVESPVLVPGSFGEGFGLVRDNFTLRVRLRGSSCVTQMEWRA